MRSVGPSFVSQFQRKNEDLIQRADDSGSDLASISLPQRAKSRSMPRSLSLKNRERIRLLFRSAKRRSSKSLTVFYRICPSNGGDKITDSSIENSPAKWLVAIPKRTGNAVRRNKLRRVLRETIRLWPKRAHVDGEIIVRFNAPFKSKQQRQKSATKEALSPVNKNSLVLNREAIHTLRQELLGLLEEIYSNVTKN